MVMPMIDRGQNVASRTLVLAAIVLFSSPSCFGSNRERCVRSSDCESAICTGNGFCEKECTSDKDCPCSAYCAASCGLCMLVDGSGPATCFNAFRLVSTESALSACAADPLPVARFEKCEAKPPSCDGGAPSADDAGSSAPEAGSDGGADAGTGAITDAGDGGLDAGDAGPTGSTTQ